MKRPSARYDVAIHGADTSDPMSDDQQTPPSLPHVDWPADFSQDPTPKQREQLKAWWEAVCSRPAGRLRFGVIRTRHHKDDFAGELLARNRRRS